uniref:Uncharacterized protein n=2 Tax=Anguilla anguilla TaxID=7936 RepID=A0A0E9PEP2_ANGAN
MFIELVAKPMPKAMADSTPRNFAMSSSSSSCLSKLPISCLVLLTPTPYFLVTSAAASAHTPVFSAKPR